MATYGERSRREQRQTERMVARTRAAMTEQQQREGQERARRVAEKIRERKETQ